MLAAILTICGAVTGVVACDKANAQVDNPAPAVKSTELIHQRYNGGTKLL